MQWKASGPVLDVNDMCFVKNEIEKSKLPKAFIRGTTGNDFYRHQICCNHETCNIMTNAQIKNLRAHFASCHLFNKLAW